MLRLKPLWKWLLAQCRTVLCGLLIFVCRLLKNMHVGCMLMHITSHHPSDPRVPLEPLRLQAQLESACTHARAYTGTDLWVKAACIYVKWRLLDLWFGFWFFFDYFYKDVPGTSTPMSFRLFCEFNSFSPLHSFYLCLAFVHRCILKFKKINTT